MATAMFFGRVAVIAGAALLMAGCGEPPLHDVTGKVTLDGKPLSGALVTFLSEGEPRRFHLARTDADGRYRLRPDASRSGAVAGRYVVRVTTFQEGDSRVDPPVPAIPERVPARYNVESQLRAEVIAGPNEFAFDLESKPRP